MHALASERLSVRHTYLRLTFRTDVIFYVCIFVGGKVKEIDNNNYLISLSFIKPFGYTGCPIDMLTTSDQILKIEKSHMSKSKPCFKIFE